MITLETLTMQRGTRPLLEGARAVVHAGQKAALIGANGSGKSSLFELLLGRLSPEQGTVSMPPGWRIAHMAQEVAASDRRALDYVLDGDGELRRVQAAMDEAEQSGDMGRLAELHQKLDDLDGYTAGVRAEKLLHGLGFSVEETTRPVGSFSGGWRIRLNLARALMCPSDLLLLDEPTNHLDFDASLWLEDWLRRYPGTLILISHDRDFIDNVCDLVLHMEHRQIYVYRGNYSSFERQRAERLAVQQAAWEKQQRRIAEIHQFVSRFRAQANKARQAQSRLKELERMEHLLPAHVDSPFDFAFPPPERVSDPLLNISDGELGYPGSPVLRDVSLSLHPGSRIGLLGANGAGKSTLIRTLAGELPLLAGRRVTGEHLSIGYFSQHQVDSLDLGASALLHLQRLAPRAREQQIRNFLGGFDFAGDMALEPVERLSGGEKARLALAAIVWLRPNLLLLDEPTNHLDLEMRQALTLALQGFEGAMVLVSHDRHLIRNSVDRLVLVSEGRVEEYEDDLDSYGRWLARTLSAGDGGEEPAAEVPARDRRSERQAAAEQRRQLAPCKKALGKLERRIEELDARLLEIDQKLADASVYETANKERLRALLRDQGDLQREKSDVEEHWLEKQEELDALEAGLPD